jgi:hypothetical protein
MADVISVALYLHRARYQGLVPLSDGGLGTNLMGQAVITQSMLPNLAIDDPYFCFLEYLSSQVAGST